MVGLKSFRGFTLAEVLITLVIIGVIASMTIPTLMNKTNKQEYISRLKKAYSTLAQATNKIIAEEGNPRGDIGGWATSTEAIYNMYLKHISKAKECGSAGRGCFEGTYKRIDRTTTAPDFDASTRYKFVMADGTEVSMLNADSDFSYNCSVTGSGSDNLCQLIRVDINGAKGPNIIGYDLFSFTLKEDGLVPSGCDRDVCVITASGYGCACKVLREGAINY